jgi:hypothetical protein
MNWTENSLLFRAVLPGIYLKMNILIQFGTGIPKKLLPLIKMRLNKTKVKSVSKLLSDGFPIQNAMKQGA